MSSIPVLSDRDVNAPVSNTDAKDTNGGVKSLDYHRQMLHSKLKEDGSKHQYISPSDGIMSPCTAKLSAYRNKHIMKAKPQSLFGKATSNGAKLSGNMSPFDTPKPETNDSGTESGTDESSAAASKEQSPGP